MTSPIVTSSARVVRHSMALVRAHILLVVPVLGFAACGGDTLVSEPSTDASGLYWALTLDQRAVTMAMMPPYDTLTLVATPRNVQGEALEGLGAITYTSTDLKRVRVSPGGVLQALATGSRVPVVATLSARGLTHVDTVLVTIGSSAPAQPVASLSVQSIAPDSTKLAAGATKTLKPKVLDGSANTVANVLVDIRSLNPRVATVTRASNVLKGVRPGTVMLIASATTYGVRVADTVTYTVGLPISGSFRVTSKTPENRLTTVTGFLPNEIRVGVGATVSWVWTFDLQPTNVVFADPTFVAEDTVGVFGLGARTGAGDIPPPDRCTTASHMSAPLVCLRTRRFSVPGVYPFQSTLTGATGKVIVEAEPPATP